MAEYASDVNDQGQGGFLSNIPMWVWVVGAGILILLFFVMGRGNTSSGSAQGPLLATQPDTTNSSTSGNLTPALDKIQTNQNTIIDAIKKIVIPATVTPTPTPTPTPSPTPNPTPVSTPAPVAAPAVSGPPNRYYTVVSGDTLWGISQRYYGNGGEYHKIFNANNGPGQISDPNLIFPGQRLLIPA